MRWTPKHISIGMLAVAAAILAVAAMNPVDPTPEMTGPIGSGLSVDPSSDNPATEDPPAPSTPRPVITLGDLDPPPDPCTVIGWTDHPAQTRPITDTTPTRRSRGHGDDFIVGYRIDSSTGGDGPGAARRGATTLTVTWDTTWPLSRDSSRDPNATTTTVGDRTAVHRIDTNQQGRPMCIGLIPATGGVAGAEATTTTRLSMKDAYAAVAAALPTIATTIR